MDISTWMTMEDAEKYLTIVKDARCKKHNKRSCLKCYLENIL